MATSNRERVDRALTLLSEGLAPFVDQHCRARYGDNWVEKFAKAKSYEFGKTVTINLEDLQFQLKTMIDEWRNIFSKTLGHAERNLVGELYDTRNRWAHQGSFSIDQAYRAADSALLLAQAVSAGEQALELDKMKHELLRIKFDEERKRRPQKDAESGIQVSAPGGLAPWREVVTPHPDVASGRYQQAEFAADLYQVAHDLGEPEYRDPVEFFRRTFLTQGLRELLVDTSRRLRGEGGNPIVQLQTNFGGGKTHSMIALFHLATGVEPEKLLGVEEMLQEAGVAAPPAATTAVLVGHMLSPNTPHIQPDGTEVRTLWGELAWQLGGRAAYDLVAEADRTGTSPGDRLVEVIRSAAPCLILIDEWVAYARQLSGVNDLPAGNFDAHFSFAQALCDAVKIVPNALLVVSIPSSDVEVGGDGGRVALERLTNVIGRQDSPWRPASAEEGFEIVRRRLFQDVSADSARERDSVVRAFGDLYRSQPAEFPSPTREGRYEDRLLAAYPIHPELFDRLYEDWSTLDKFQRTRGVLRLMAAVIHELWERQDSGLLITPASVPIDAPAVKSELTRYLDDGWDPVIAADVDGPSSLPLQIDRENPNLGRYSAARRVARTIYLGSAAVKEAANRGLDERSVKLGCVQPGESAAVFGDALRKLTDRATYLYAANERVWYSLQPSVTRMAADRAARVPLDEVDEEIRRRLMAQRDRGEFAAVHVSPESGREVEDRAAARLVILGPDHPHATRSEVSLALDVAKEMLEERHGGPRTYRNMLVFLAPDQARLEELRDAVRQWTAWDTIVGEAEELNLDAQQRRQAETKQRQSTETVNQRIGETFQWLVVPTQKEPGDPEVTWEVLRVTGQDPLAVRASRKLQSDEHLITAYSGTRVRMDLDKVPLWRGDHVGVRQLWDDYARYLYLPRLRDEQVMLKAIADGVASTIWDPETFGYADSYNDETGEYRGTKAGEQATVVMDSASVVIKPEKVVIGKKPEIADDKKEREPPLGVTRFHAVVDLDRDKVSKHLLDVLQHVIEHLENAGADVSLTLEMEASSAEPFDDATQRTVTENAHTLKFRIHGFER